MKKNLNSYLINLQELDFERTQELMRLKKIKEIVYKLNLPINESIIEVGPGQRSIFTDISFKNPKILIEPIKELLDRNRILLKNDNQIKFELSTIENYHHSRNVKTCFIMMSSNLHEILDPKQALKSCYKALSEGGKLLIVVPNQNSLHRILGVKLGLQKKIKTLTITEKRMQQYRSYNINSLQREVKRAGFEVQSVETSFIKPLSHLQMQELQSVNILNLQNLEFLYSLSAYLPDFGSEIFLVAKKISN